MKPSAVSNCVKLRLRYLSSSSSFTLMIYSLVCGFLEAMPTDSEFTLDESVVVRFGTGDVKAAGVEEGSRDELAWFPSSAVVCSLSELGPEEVLSFWSDCGGGELMESSIFPVTRVLDQLASKPSEHQCKNGEIRAKCLVSSCASGLVLSDGNNAFYIG